MHLLGYSLDLWYCKTQIIFIKTSILKLEELIYGNKAHLL